MTPNARIRPFPVAARRRPRVLVVDDSPTVREYLEVALTEEGFEAHIAADEAEAFRLLARAKPDVVVLDMRLPETTGETITAFLKGPLRHPAPIVVYSGHTHLAGVARALGASAFVPKTAPLDDLLVEIRRALASWEAPR